jgi:hypothetical protein
MSVIVKACKIHGNLTENQVYRRKPPRNEIVCKQCNNTRSSIHRYKTVSDEIIERKCSRCRIIKPKSEFKPYQWKLLSPYCDICRFQNSTKEYHKNRSHLKRRFGLDINEYETILIQQNYACAICKKSESALGTKSDGSPKRLSVDHCHKTKIIRGLLCQRCNSGLGQFFDNPEYLESAINFLENTNKHK